MSILSIDDYLASTRQRCPIIRTGAITTVAAQWYTVFHLAGQPGGGVLAGGKTTPDSLATGGLATSSTPGYPTINAFAGGAKGYVSKIDYGNTVACRIALYDRIWISGAHAFNAAQAVTSPSWAARCTFDGVVDYKGLEIWVEQVTVGVGTQTVNVQYLDELGNASGASNSLATAPVGRCWQLGLGSGDSGVSGVTQITGTGATGGTFNVMVLRPLWEGRVRLANDGDVHDFLKTGMPEVFADSALYALIAADGTSSGVPELAIQIASK